ncbi:hypothetical protein PFISCL1PPCAC_13277, partial [Pristionchus fissidentatus]
LKMRLIFVMALVSCALAIPLFSLRSRRDEVSAGGLHKNKTIVQDWMVQTFDHLNSSEVRTFRQKWWMNKAFGSAESANFL